MLLMTTQGMLLCYLMGITAAVISSVQADDSTMAPQRIIDTHIHLWDTGRPQGLAWPGENSELYKTYVASHFNDVAATAGVTGAVIVEASAWVEDNQWMLDHMKDKPTLLALVGNLALDREEFGDNLARFAANPQFVGIRPRIGKADLENPRVLANLRDLEVRNLALDVAIVGDMTLADVVAIATALPKMRIVVNHVATRHINGNPPDSAWVAAVAALRHHPNVYMKISGLYQNTRTKPAPTDLEHYASTFDALWKALGEDRLVYGSNWPVSTLYGAYKPNVDIVLAYLDGKPVEAREKVLWRNAVKAYNIPGVDFRDNVDESSTKSK